MDCLADEIVLKIIDELRDDHTALVNLAKACKHFYAMTEAYRFRKVHLRTKGDYLLLEGHLQSKDSLRDMVETLIIGPTREIWKKDFWDLKQTTRWIPNLKHLLIRYPQGVVESRHEALFYSIRGSFQFYPPVLRSCKFIIQVLLDVMKSH